MLGESLALLSSIYFDSDINTSTSIARSPIHTTTSKHLPLHTFPTMVTSTNEKRPTSAFKKGSLRDHAVERTDINKDDALNIALYFKPDLTIAVSSSREASPISVTRKVNTTRPPRA
jgi:hypothetical protein